MYIDCICLGLALNCNTILFNIHLKQTARTEMEWNDVAMMDHEEPQCVILVATDFSKIFKSKKNVYWWPHYYVNRRGLYIPSNSVSCTPNQLIAAIGFAKRHLFTCIKFLKFNFFLMSLPQLATWIFLMAVNTFSNVLRH